MKYTLAEEYKKGSAKPSEELEKYISAVIMDISNECLGDLKKKLIIEHLKRPLTENYGLGVFQREFHRFCYIVLYKTVAFFSPNKYVVYRYREAFLDPEMPKFTRENEPPALTASELFVALYFAYTDKLPISDTDDSLTKQQKALAFAMFKEVTAGEYDGAFTHNPPLPDKPRNELLLLQESIEIEWKTYDNAILDTLGASSDKINSAYALHRISAKQRDDALQALQALYYIIQSYPDMMQNALTAFENKKREFSEKYYFDDTEFMPIIKCRENRSAMSTGSSHDISNTECTPHIDQSKSCLASSWPYWLAMLVIGFIIGTIISLS